MPRLRWSASEHQRTNRPGASRVSRRLTPPGSTVPTRYVRVPPIRLRRRSCSSSPKLTSSRSGRAAADRRSREREAELVRRHLHAGRRGGEQGGQHEERGNHFRIRGRANERAGDDPVRVGAEPVFEQRRIQPAEVRCRAQVAVLVELRQPRVLPDQRAAGAGADEEADAGSTVVGAVRAVLLRAASELRPDVDEHAVGEAARLDVALEGQEARRGERQPVGERPGWSSCVSYMPGAVSATARTGRPAPSIAASPASRRGNASSPSGYVTGLVKPGLSFFGVNGRSCSRRRAAWREAAVAWARAGSPPCGQAPSSPSDCDQPLLDVAPYTSRPEVVAVGGVDRGDRDLGGRERRLKAGLEREPLQRVARRARRGRDSGRASR